MKGSFCSNKLAFTELLSGKLPQIVPAELLRERDVYCYENRCQTEHKDRALQEAFATHCCASVKLLWRGSSATEAALLRLQKDVAADWSRQCSSDLTRGSGGCPIRLRRR